ncbi:hypothetical protein [Photobacterium damselae]|uniref:hypothetical protein n=1 Tax=Photobacterium damselae TaxID=38293 RepID=UPI001F314A4C|nr:hypothetical protein [Photobacterium damselae]UKA04585.1 hypothetical protein IHC89_23490 [Photobacterium damselae subsp. damselae]
MSIKIIIGADIKHQHRKMERFCSGFRYLNHFYSNKYQDKYDNILATYPSAKKANFISAELELYSSAYSKDKFSRDTIRILSDIERYVFVNLRVTPIGFDVKFNDTNKSIKAVFYFLNFSRMDESYRLLQITDEQLTLIENKIGARVGNAKTISFSSQPQQLEEKSNGSVSVDFSDAMAASVSDLITLLGEPDYRVAMQRALRGLDKKQATKLIATLNDIISLSGDQSVEVLSMPKKHQTRADEKDIESESLFDCMSD